MKMSGMKNFGHKGPFLSVYGANIHCLTIFGHRGKFGRFERFEYENIRF